MFNSYILSRFFHCQDIGEALGATTGCPDTDSPPCGDIFCKEGLSGDSAIHSHTADELKMEGILAPWAQVLKKFLFYWSHCFDLFCILMMWTHFYTLILFIYFLWAAMMAVAKQQQLWKHRDVKSFAQGYRARKCQSDTWTKYQDACLLYLICSTHLALIGYDELVVQTADAWSQTSLGMNVPSGTC